MDKKKENKTVGQLLAEKNGIRPYPLYHKIERELDNFRIRNAP